MIMDDLIVDFPSERKTVKGCVRGRKSKRSVRFAEMCLLAITEPKSPEELAATWCSKRERDAFRIQLMRDLSRMRRKVATTPMASIGDDDMYGLIGMEAILSQDVLVRTKQHKVDHVNTLLAEQARQRRSNAYDYEELSRVACESSEKARNRAHKVAKGYWDVLK
mmetsp:Transcript_32758/g.55733  ORF Transcript_32758/g.55733 Transcript_32758/m.55733 type:complete len:165 (-) Transcript_32758:672-1166(-)